MISLFLAVGLGVGLVWLALMLPRVAGLLLFCFFATGCVKCGAGGDPFNAVMLLIEGTVVAWMLFAVADENREKLRAKAKETPPEATL